MRRLASPRRRAGPAHQPASRGPIRSTHPRLASLAASRRPALRVPRRDLHDNDRESVGVAGHHLDEAPGLALRLLLDHDIRGGEPSPLLVDIADLKQQDRKSTRLNSSHITISYAVFCLKKKKKNKTNLLCQKKRQSKLKNN